MKKKLIIFATALLVSGSALNVSANEWKKDTTGWWYQHTDGSYSMNKWEQIDGKWYAFDGNGYMRTGWFQDGSKWYYLNADGSMAVNTIIDGCQIGADGIWIQNETTPLFDFDIENDHIKYTGFKIKQDYEGNNCLVLYYDYTNKEDKAKGMWLSDINVQVFQNGVECESAFIWSDRDDSMDNYSKDIMKNVTINVAESYKLYDMSDVTIQIEELWNWTNPKTTTVTLKLQ